MYSIYVHTTPDGLKYVGFTGQEPIKRFGGGSHYRNNIRFYDAIKFFGWDNIEHQVLETVKDKKIALKREEYYTLLFRSNEPEFGYNIQVGCIKDEDGRKKHSEKLKGRKHSEETKKKQSESLKEYYKNNEFPEYRKKKISEITRKHIRLKNISNGEIIEFYSHKSCAKFFGVNNSYVSRFINGTRQCKLFKDYEVLK